MIVREVEAAFRKLFLRKRNNKRHLYPKQKLSKQDSYCNSAIGAVLHFKASLALFFVRCCRSIATYKLFWPMFY